MKRHGLIFMKRIRLLIGRENLQPLMIAKAKCVILFSASGGVLWIRG